MLIELIPRLRGLRYEERLKECGLTTLETRKLREKILSCRENIDPNMFVTIKTGKRTRGHYDFTLEKGQSRLDVRKYSFSQGTIHEWNKLYADCVHSNRIDNYLLHVY